MGRLRQPAERRWRAARVEPRGRDPFRRAGDHARDRDRAAPPGVRTRGEPAPRAAGRGHDVGAPRRRHRAPRQRVPAVARRGPTRAGLPRRHERHRQALLAPIPAEPLRPRRLRRDRDALGRARRSDRGRRRRRIDADHLEEQSPREDDEPSVLPGDGEHGRVRTARSGRLLPGQVQDPRAAAGVLRRPAEPGALLTRTGDGRVRAHPPPHPGRALRHAAQTTECVVRMKRVLVTGLSTFWGGRLAQVLEARNDIDVIVGVDTREPRVPLERTEFVRADSGYSILSRIVRATQIDTILHTHLIVDSTLASGRSVHEINVIGTMNLLAAAGAAGSPVRKVIVKGSSLVYGSNFRDPYMFREEMPRTRGPNTNVERSLLEVEAFLRDFAEDNPHVIVTLLRFANVLGDDIETPIARALRMPVVPEIAGFDPRVQFVHEDDVVGALTYAT